MHIARNSQHAVLVPELLGCLVEQSSDAGFVQQLDVQKKSLFLFPFGITGCKDWSKSLGRKKFPCRRQSWDFQKEWKLALNDFTGAVYEAKKQEDGGEAGAADAEKN